MTVIIGYTFEQIPVLIGDTLISRTLSMDEDSPSRYFDTPARNDVNKYLDEYTWAEVVGMRQKVNIIDKHVMMAWAGSEIQARAAAKDIKDWAARHKSNTSSLPDVIGRIPETDLSDCSLIAFARGKTRTNICYRNMPTYAKSPFDNLWISGSGQDDAEKIIPLINLDDLREARQNNDLSYSAAVKAALELSAQCFSFDFFTVHGLKSFWGGAMEVATFDNGIARKVGSVLYAFWIYANEKQPIKHFDIDPIFVKVDYQGHNMVIRVMRQIGGTDSNAVFRNQFYVVRPLIVPPHERATTHLSIRVPQMRYKFLCSTVLWMRGSKLVNSFTDVAYCNVGMGPIRFPQEGRLISVEVNTNYMLDLLEQSMRRFYPEYTFYENSMSLRTFETQDEYRKYIKNIPNTE